MPVKPASLKSLELRQHRPLLALDLRDGTVVVDGIGARMARLPRGLKVAATPVAGNAAQSAASLQLQLVENGQRILVWFGKVINDKKSPRAMPIRSGQLFRIRIETDSPVFLPATFEHVLPPAGGLALRQITLQPGYAYPFDRIDTVSEPDDQEPGLGPTLLHGTFIDSNGQGRAGGKVSVTPLRPPAPPEAVEQTYDVDATGQWLFAFGTDVFPQGALEGPAATLPVTIVFDSGDGGPTRTRDVTLVRGREVTAYQSSIAGRAVDRNGRPIAGTVVEISGRSERSAAAADGTWSLYLPPDEPAGLVEVDLILTAPNGRQQRLAQVPLEAGRAARAGDIIFD